MVKLILLFCLLASPAFGAYSPTLDQGAPGVNAWPVSQPDLIITGAAAQTVLNNNVVLATAGAAATDVSGFRSGSIQLVSTATAGAFIFENSNDNVNFQVMPVYNSASVTATPITAAITATASQNIYTFPIRARYLRVRISTALTGGAVQAYSRISQESWSPAVVGVAQPTAGSLNTNVSGNLTTISSITAAFLGTSTTADIASAAITATATSSAVTLANIQSVSWVFAVTAVSGTAPTLDIVVQESLDNVNWIDLYHCERITTTTQPCVVPAMKLHGIYIRYVRTITGTTPSFTMSALRTSKQISAPFLRRLFDRTINPNTLNSTTPVLVTEGCDEVQFVQSSGAGATVTPSFALEGSEDQVQWYAIMNTSGALVLSGTASTTSASFVGFIPKFMRTRVSTAGTGATLNYVSMKCRGA